VRGIRPHQQGLTGTDELIASDSTIPGDHAIEPSQTLAPGEKGPASPNHLLDGPSRSLQIIFVR
jgi:hypothetical protein